MESRFAGVGGAAVLIEFAFWILGLIGLLLLVSGGPNALMAPFAEIPRNARLVLAGSLIFVSVLGVMLPGAVRVLIAIEANTNLTAAKQNPDELSEGDRQVLRDISVWEDRMSYVPKSRLRGLLAVPGLSPTRHRMTASGD